MKATIVSEEKKQLSNVFPCMRKSNTSGQVVLFTSDQTGVVVVMGNNVGSHHVGYYGTSWVHYDDYGVWQVVNDITINFKMD